MIKLKSTVVRKMVSKEGICTYTGNDNWLMQELGIPELEVRTIKIGVYAEEGKCVSCGKVTWVNNYQLCQTCNPYEQHDIMNKGEI